MDNFEGFRRESSLPKHTWESKNDSCAEKGILTKEPHSFNTAPSDEKDESVLFALPFSLAISTIQIGKAESKYPVFFFSSPALIRSLSGYSISLS